MLCKGSRGGFLFHNVGVGVSNFLNANVGVRIFAREQAQTKVDAIVSVLLLVSNMGKEL